MKDRMEVARAIDILILPNPDCICWCDLGAGGSACYDPDHYASDAEKEEEAFTLAAVHLEMAKNSSRHKKLAKAVAGQLGKKYVTYPFLRDAVCRLLSGTSYKDLLAMVRLSRLVRDRMKAKGLTEIHSLEEAFS